MYRLGQSFPRPFAGYEYPKKKHPYVPTRLTVNFQSIADNVTVTQTIVGNKWIYRTIVQAVTVTQGVLDPSINHQSVTDNVTVSQTIVANQWVYKSIVQAVTVTQGLVDPFINHQSVTDNVTISQAINVQQWVNRSIVQAVTVAQTIAVQKWINRTIVHSVTVTQGMTHGKLFVLIVAHDVTVAESIRLNKVKHLTVSHSVTVGQLFRESQIITDSVTVGQTISFTRVLSRSISHNVTVIQSPFINSPRTLNVFHNVSVFDTFTPRLATYRLSVTDNVSTLDSIDARNATFHLSVIDTVSVSQIARVIGAVYLLTVTDSITVNQKVNLQYPQSVVHDVAVFHSYTKKKYITRLLTTDLSGTSTFDRNVTYVLTTNLILSSEFTRQVVYNRTLIDSETLNSDYTATLFIPNPGPHPVISGVNYTYGYLTLLESIYGTIVLPVPELNDSMKHNDSMTLKRTMSGNISAYVKKANTQILTYTWLLDYTKALEFKQWALTNFSERITLTNWKGEIWIGKIISDDLTLKAETKYQGNPRQKTSVTIEFEGIKING